MNAPDIFLDTSVVVRGLVEGMLHHRQARSYLDKARRGAAQVAISTHTLAELFATLTALPTRPRHSPADAHALIDGATHALRAVSLDTAGLPSSTKTAYSCTRVWVVRRSIQWGRWRWARAERTRIVVDPGVS